MRQPQTNTKNNEWLSTTPSTYKQTQQATRSNDQPTPLQSTVQHKQQQQPRRQIRGTTTNEYQQNHQTTICNNKQQQTIDITIYRCTQTTTKTTPTATYHNEPTPTTTPRTTQTLTKRTIKSTESLKKLWHLMACCGSAAKGRRPLNYCKAHNGCTSSTTVRHHVVPHTRVSLTERKF